ncbi:MAG: aminoacyl-tRNA hydrolase [Patescibacteria group bacterium]
MKDFFKNRVIFGLGNLGEKFEKTYHNVGFLFLDKLKDFAEKDFGVKFSFSVKLKLLAEICEINFLSEKIILVKPTTFMNRVGNSAILVSQFYKIPVENFLIVGDYIDRPVGTIDFIPNFSKNQSHNGIESLRNVCKIKEFNFIRIGILPEKFLSDYKGKFDNLGVGNLADFVLQKIPKDNFEKIENAIENFIFEK